MGALSIISIHWEYFGVPMYYQIFKVVGEFEVYACWCHPNCGHESQCGFSCLGHVCIRRRACTQVLFLCKAELGFFHFLEIVTGWLLPSARQKIPEQPGWYLADGSYGSYCGLAWPCILGMSLAHGSYCGLVQPCILGMSLTQSIYPP